MYKARIHHKTVILDQFRTDLTNHKYYDYLMLLPDYDYITLRGLLASDTRLRYTSDKLPLLLLYYLRYTSDITVIAGWCH